MNNYQESLDKILYLLKEFTTEGYEVINFHMNGETEPLENFVHSNIDDEDIDFLKEAIDKAVKYDEKETPTEATCYKDLNYGGRYYECKCGFDGIISGMKYCSNCGQKIKSDVEV